MFVFNKKLFAKFIQEPLLVTPADKRRFSGFTKEKVLEITKEKDEWKKLTKTIKGKLKSGVIPYLTGVFTLLYLF